MRYIDIFKNHDSIFYNPSVEDLGGVTVIALIKSLFIKIFPAKGYNFNRENNTYLGDTGWFRAPIHKIPPVNNLQNESFKLITGVELRFHFIQSSFSLNHPAISFFGVPEVTNSILANIWNFSKYILFFGFILIPLKNTAKLLTEFLMGVLQILCLKGFTYLRKTLPEFVTENQIHEWFNRWKMNLSVVLELYVKGFFMAILFPLFFAFGILSRISRAVFAPLASFKEAWEINPILGMVSAAISFVTIVGLVSIASPIILGLMAFTGLSASTSSSVLVALTTLVTTFSILLLEVGNRIRNYFELKAIGRNDSLTNPKNSVEQDDIHDVDPEYIDSMTFTKRRESTEATPARKVTFQAQNDESPSPARIVNSQVVVTAPVESKVNSSGVPYNPNLTIETTAKHRGPGTPLTTPDTDPSRNHRQRSSPMVTPELRFIAGSRRLSNLEIDARRNSITGIITPDTGSQTTEGAFQDEAYTPNPGEPLSYRSYDV